MFHAIGHFVTRHPRAVLSCWLLLLLVCFPFARRIGDVLTTDAGFIPGSDAAHVNELIRSEFAGEHEHQLLVVARSPRINAPDPGALQQAFIRALDDIRNVDQVARVIDGGAHAMLPSFAETGRIGLAIIELSTTDWIDAQNVAAEVEALLPTAGLLDYYLTGAPAVERELQEVSSRDAVRAELVGLPLSLVVLVLVFGAVVAASIPVMVAIASITMSLTFIYLIGHIMPVAAFAQITITMLGLATGIDYALVMVNRYREELARGLSRIEAAVTTTSTAGRAVTFSGLTVLGALTALLIPPLDFIRSLGISGMTVMFFSVAISVTAVPALLSLLGGHVNALKLTRQTPGTRSRGFWRAQANRIMRRPVLWAAVGTSALLLIALPALTMNVGFAGVKGLTEDTSARNAQLVLEELDLDGMLHSFDVLVDFGERGLYHPSSVRATSRLTRDVGRLETVQQVVSPTTAGTLPPLVVMQYYATPETALESPLADLARTTVSGDGRYALLRAFPDSDWMPERSRELATDLRAIGDDLELTLLVGGDYVWQHEWAGLMFDNLPLAIGVVFVITFVLLGLAFRSILIPIKSILLNTLTVGAAFGVIVLVFQHGYLAPLFGLSEGLGFVETSVPIFIFAVVFGLSMDYEVFLVSRVVEGHERGMSDRDAIVHALTATGNVITSAAVIMIIVFSVFLFSNVVLIKTLALGLAVAVLLDATLTRLTLVPSIMLLAGKLNWWLPRPLARVMKRIRVGQH